MFVRQFVAALAFVCVACASSVAPPPVVTTSCTVPDTWSQLMDGNGAFRGNAITFSDLNRIRACQIPDQHPKITILACSDSRVPPELAFHQTLGNLFVVRAAGNVADVFGIASIEYAIKHDYAKLLVILAHEKCGAVRAAIDADPPPPQQTPSLNALVSRIRASFTDGQCTFDNPPGCWERRAKENALGSVKDLMHQSAVICKAITTGETTVVVAYYDLDGGVTRIPWSPPGRETCPAIAAP
jgi:carbonic anhydrase